MHIEFSTVYHRLNVTNTDKRGQSKPCSRTIIFPCCTAMLATYKLVQHTIQSAYQNEKGKNNNNNKKAARQKGVMTNLQCPLSSQEFSTSILYIPGAVISPYWCSTFQCYLSMALLTLFSKRAKQVRFNVLFHDILYTTGAVI